MDEETELRETGNGTVQRIPVSEDAHMLTLSPADQIEDGSGDWGFTIFANEKMFVASVSYATQADAIRGRVAMAEALKDAIFIATSES